MKHLKIFLLICCVFTTISLRGNQKHVVDSLKIQLEQSVDSLKAPILLQLCWEHRNFNPELSVKFGLEAIEVARQYNDYRSIANAHSFVGVAYRIMGNYSQSIDHYFTGLDVATRHKIKEQEGFAYINIANLHIYQEHYTKANENLIKALAIAKETNNKSMLAYVYINSGRAKQLMNELDSALVYYNKALEIRKTINQIPQQAVCYKYIGDIYFLENNVPLALENYNNSLAVVNKEIDRDLYANILIKLAQIDFKANRLTKSLDLANKGKQIANDIGARLVIRDASQLLAEISLLKGDYKRASYYLKSVIQYNDSLFSQQLSEKIFFVEYQLEKEIKESKINILNKDNTIKELMLARARTSIITLAIIIVLLAILFIFTLFLLNFRRTRNKMLEKQNIEINNQRISIERKNKNLEEAYTVIEGYIGKITDSLLYAEQIQEAILPPLSSYKPFFSDVFCFYKSKDFVSGDFYWLSVKDNNLLFAVGDCTGHGVPGAFMSIIGMDLLNQAVIQQHLETPSAILHFLNVELPRKLKREHSELILKDSMDIAVCSFNRESNKLYYSGALIPFMMIRDQQITCIKSDYTSIGSSTKVFSKAFNQHTVDLKKGDWVYLYSDGYMDQIGGDKKKKFMRNHFQNTLLTLSQYNSEVHLSELENIFIQWKGNNEQIDDVLILGLKV